MTARRLTPGMMRALEPYLPVLIAGWLRASEDGGSVHCPLCAKVGAACWRCPVFARVAARDDAQRRVCFGYFAEAEAYHLRGDRRNAAATVKRLEAVQRWLAKDKEAKPGG